MAFTYLGDLSTDRERVRFYLQDTDATNGPKPEDANFTDEELDGVIATEGSWTGAVAAGFEALASAWRKHPDFKADDLSVSRTDIADGYAKAAALWREKTGAPSTTAGAGSRPVTRVDGYSSDVDSHTV